MDSQGAPEGLTYEETPVIDPVAEPPQRTRPSFWRVAGTGLLFIVLFLVGVGISVFLREMRSPLTPKEEIRRNEGGEEITEITPQQENDPYERWQSTPVMSAITKQPVEGIRFFLPPDVLTPVCDGEQCASQGTYLPAGTRFTVAARGSGQLLVDARGNVLITDSFGTPFTIEEVTLASGRKALEYTGDFRGTTVGGYTFTRMRGLMIEIDEDETLEMNHFAPAGVDTDFVQDDELFDAIVASLSVNVPSTTSAIGR